MALCKHHGAVRSVFAALSVLVFLGSHGARAQTATPLGIELKTVGEVRAKGVATATRDASGLVPADHVVPGDEIIYTVEIHNPTSQTVSDVIVTHPVPEHMLYVANSATGPAADVTFSVDSGHHYGKPDELTMPITGGGTRQAAVADYTDIRWDLKKGLRASATAFARFRAVLK